MENFNNLFKKSEEEGLLENTDTNKEKMDVATRAILDAVYNGLFPEPEYYKGEDGADRVRVKNEKGDVVFDDKESAFHGLVAEANASRDAQIYEDENIVGSDN